MAGAMLMAMMMMVMMMMTMMMMMIVQFVGDDDRDYRDGDAVDDRDSA